MTREYGLVLSIAILAGCVSSQTHLSVPIDPTAGRAAAARQDTLVTVAVHDLRWKLHPDGTREAAWGAPMGDVGFAPTAPVIVQERLEFDLDRIASSKGATQRRAFDCDLFRFDVRTNTSPLYWDVIVNISLVIKPMGRDSLRLSSTATHRTWVWPGETVIRETVYSALDSLTARLDARADEFAFSGMP